MFDVSFSELVVIFFVALMVIGPEKLPKVAKVLTDIAWKPNDNEMDNVTFDNYDWKKWDK